MAYHNNSELTLIIIAPPDQAEEGDRLFRSHGSWMEATHHRSGAKALLSYNVSKGPELSNAMDLNSAPTGNTCFVLTETYESGSPAPGGIGRHQLQRRCLRAIP
ncbi:MAG: hypothetical protein WBL39_14830 [Terrimicrobiaceae bacterium]